MLPLAGESFPTSADELTRSLQGGLAARGVAPVDVRVGCSEWPRVDALSIDLSATRITRDVRLPSGTGPFGETLQCGVIEITGAPLLFEGTPVRLALTARAVTLGWARGGQGESMLSLQAASEGSVHIRVAKMDLEAMLQREAAAAAGNHGVEVRKTTLQLTALHSRALAVQAEVTAKMFVMSAAVKLSGEVSVYDTLSARLSQLRVSADGMVGSMVNSFARPVLERWEGREIPLLAFSLGGMKLRDVSVQGGDALQLEAQFGA